jgi:hypothetical protein
MVRSPEELIGYLTEVLHESGAPVQVPESLLEQSVFFDHFCQDIPTDLAKEARMSALVFASSPAVLNEMCSLVTSAHRIYGGFGAFVNSPLRESVLNAVNDRESLRSNLAHIGVGPLTSEGAKAILSASSRLVVAYEQQGMDVQPLMCEVADLLGRVATGVTLQDLNLIHCLFLG